MKTSLIALAVTFLVLAAIVLTFSLAVIGIESRIERTQRWRLLRQDRAANIAVLAGFGALLPAALAWMALLLPNNRAADHNNPVYWFILLPVILWTLAAGSFAPWALRLLRPVLILAPLFAAFALAVAFDRDVPQALWLGALAVSVSAALVGWRAYGRSLLAVKTRMD